MHNAQLLEGLSFDERMWTSQHVAWDFPVWCNPSELFPPGLWAACPSSQGGNRITPP